ncbi:uncharacterized protein LOC130716988 [Lotus japonicus]|nr:uncharacterized protein LOC130716988 [Lotus japonicus]
MWDRVLSEEEIRGTSNVGIPTKITKELFAHKPTEIEVILPDGTWTKWGITWHDMFPTKGTFDQGWQEFHNQEFDNTCLVGGEHHFIMWKRNEENTYCVQVDHWLSKREHDQQQN